MSDMIIILWSNKNGQQSKIFKDCVHNNKKIEEHLKQLFINNIIPEVYQGVTCEVESSVSIKLNRPYRGATIVTPVTTITVNKEDTAIRCPVCFGVDVNPDDEDTPSAKSRLRCFNNLCDFSWKKMDNDFVQDSIADLKIEFKEDKFKIIVGHSRSFEARTYFVKGFMCGDDTRIPTKKLSKQRIQLWKEGIDFREDWETEDDDDEW